MASFCYWTVADGDHAYLAQTMVKSARDCGVEEDFHIWSDKKIRNATTHKINKPFDKSFYLFKFQFLLNEVINLDYDYFIFLDADNYFVRHPGNILNILNGDPIHVCLESECTYKNNKRYIWWGAPVNQFINMCRQYGITNEKIYNTNAGFWIVKRDTIRAFCDVAFDFLNFARKNNCNEYTEEPPLAYVGQILIKDPDQHTLKNTSNIWASDWTGIYKNKLPDGKEWQFEDYLSGEKILVNPAIVHAMRSKDEMIKIGKTILDRDCGCNNNLNVETGYYSGHQMLGDVIGFCAAAHLLWAKTGKIIKINFEERRKDVVKYFDGIEWVEKSKIPNAIDCGINPSIDEWPKMNGVKRFYKFMDSTLTNPKSFDVHFNINKRISGKNLIGLITHSNTQGDIDPEILNMMISDAKIKFPKHKIVLIGNMDNSIVPAGVEDWRQKDGNINWIFETIRELDLLITPQSGPCFIAAGFNIPMWVYESKEKYWDFTLNYDTYKVEKWYKRHKSNILYYFDDKILLNTEKYDIIISKPSLLKNIKKENLNKFGSIIISIPESDNTLKESIFLHSQNIGLLPCKFSTNQYMLINYNDNHKKYELIGSGVNCKVYNYLNANSVIKVYHDYKKDYYNEILKLNQNFIKLPKRIFNNIINGCKIIEEEFIQKNNSLSLSDFKNKLENFSNLIKNMKGLDLFIDNLIVSNNQIYLIDTIINENCIETTYKQSWNQYISIKNNKIVKNEKNYIFIDNDDNLIDKKILKFENDKLILQTSKNKKFTEYHEIENIKGKRNCQDRIKMFNMSDIKNKSILDLCCSMGGMSFECLKNGAKNVLGVEYDDDNVKFANNYIEKNNLKNIKIIKEDIDSYSFFKRLKKFDTVLLLAVLNTSNFSEKLSILSSVSNITKNALYIEGHSGESHLEYIKNLLYYTNFTKFEILENVSSLGKRPLIRCSRETILKIPNNAVTSESTQDKIDSCEILYITTNKNITFTNTCKTIYIC